MTLYDGKLIIQPPQQVQLYIRTWLTWFGLNRIKGFSPIVLWPLN